MAATLTLLSATSNSLKYAYAYDGTGGAGSSSATRTQAQMISDLGAVVAPTRGLKNYLASLTADPDWTGAPGKPQVSLYLTNQNGTGVALLANFANIVVIGHALQIVGTDGTASQALVEVRFHHSYDR